MNGSGISSVVYIEDYILKVETLDKKVMYCDMKDFVEKNPKLKNSNFFKNFKIGKTKHELSWNGDLVISDSQLYSIGKKDGI